MGIIPRQHKRRVTKTLTVFGALAVYAFALILLPVLHFHGACCPPEKPLCSCNHHDGEPLSETSADDCDFCRFLHTSAPLVDALPPILERPCEIPHPASIASVFSPSERFGIPSSRAPPSWTLS